MASSTSHDGRKPGINKHITSTVNKALGQLGCSYCRSYKPADQVSKRRSLGGTIKNICDTCRLGRKERKGNAP